MRQRAETKGNSHHRSPQTVDRGKSASRKRGTSKLMLLVEGGRSSPDWESNIVNCYWGFATTWRTHWPKLGGKCKSLLPRSCQKADTLPQTGKQMYITPASTPNSSGSRSFLFWPIRSWRQISAQHPDTGRRTEAKIWCKQFAN